MHQMWMVTKMRVIGVLLDKEKIIYADEVIEEMKLLEILVKRYPHTAIDTANKQIQEQRVDLTHETIERIAFEVSKNMRNK